MEVHSKHIMLDGILIQTLKVDGAAVTQELILRQEIME